MGSLASNCPKFTKVCPLLFIPNACPAFLKYALHLCSCILYKTILNHNQGK